MKFIYTLNAKKNICVQKQNTLNLPNAKVEWKVDGHDNLQCIYIIFDRVPLKLNDEGLFNPNEYDVKKEAYKIATFIRNITFIQHGENVFVNPLSILHAHPKTIPETNQEIEVFGKCLKKGWGTVLFKGTVIKDIDSSQYADKYRNSLAYTYFADALRVEHPFIKYELFYKVIECFYNKIGDAQDEAVSSAVYPKDTKYDKEFCGWLRKLRNRTIHPKAGAGNINIEKLDDVILINQYIEDIERVAWILLGEI